MISVEINLQEIERRTNFAALFLLSGVIVPVLGIASGYKAVGVICSFMGVITLATGTIMFTRFLRKYPAAEGEVILEEG